MSNNYSESSKHLENKFSSLRKSIESDNESFCSRKYLNHINNLDKLLNEDIPNIKKLFEQQIQNLNKRHNLMVQSANNEEKIILDEITKLQEKLMKLNKKNAKT